MTTKLMFIFGTDSTGQSDKACNIFRSIQFPNWPPQSQDIGEIVGGFYATCIHSFLVQGGTATTAKFNRTCHGRILT